MKKNKTNAIIISTIVGIIFLIGALGIYISVTVNKWSNNIYPGVVVDDTKLAGKSKEEALKILKDRYEHRILKKKIIIVAKDKEYSIGYSDLDLKYNLKEIVDQAMSFGKDVSAIEKFKSIYMKTPCNIKIKFDYKVDVINNVIQKIKKDVDRKPINSKLKNVGNSFEFTQESNGYKLQEDKLKKEILSQINGRIDKEVIKINAPIEETKPKITKQELSKIDAKISSYTTSFNSSQGRVTNIQLATNSINGTVLMPGETFSFNDTVGQRTEARGYQKAHVIVNNEYVDDFGGGICQVSSTLYNAIVRANIDPTERYSHTIASSYVDIGQDATVSWGGPDYKFKNTLKYPIYIEGYASNSSVSFNVYSNNELNKYSYKIYSADKKTVEPTVSIIEDSSLPEGQETYVKSPYTGHSATVYREIYENGKFVKKEVLYKANIAPVNGILKKGTKKPEVKKDDAKDNSTTNKDIKNSNEKNNGKVDQKIDNNTNKKPNNNDDKKNEHNKDVEPNKNVQNNNDVKKP